MLPARRILRIVLSLVILAVLWLQVGRQWQERSVSWLVGGITLSVILLLVVIAEVTGAQRKGKKLRDQVPKKPLGLDS